MSARFELQPVAFRVEPGILAQLRDIAAAQGCTVSDLLRRGALMALEEPDRVVITWTVSPAVTMLGNTQTVAVNAATVDASAPADPGEGHRTGTGGPDAPGASEGLDAATTAATKALNREADESGSWAIGRLDPEREYWDLSGINGDARDIAEIAVRAAEPILTGRALAVLTRHAAESEEAAGCETCCSSRIKAAVAEIGGAS